MSFSNSFENDMLELYFTNLDMANVGDAAGIQNSAAAGSLYISGHTANPGEAGAQTTSEGAYTSYDRVAVARSAGGWTVSGNQVTNAAEITFPECGVTGETWTHWGIGRGDIGGSEVLDFYGPIVASSAVWLPFTAKVDDTITIPGHTLSVDHRITFVPAYNSTLPTGISEGVVYWVKTVSGDDVTISTTQGGGTLNITAVGSGACIRCSPIAISENITPRFSVGAMLIKLD